MTDDTTARRKILIVDDEYTFAEYAQTLLEHMGYDTVLARDGGQGLTLAAAEQPALILVDLAMPGMGGIEMIERLKADPATAGIPILICSITHSRAKAEPGLKRGALAFLPKPLNSAVLKAHVDLAFAAPRR